MTKVFGASATLVLGSLGLHELQSGLEGIVLVAGALTGVGVIWRYGVVPLVRFMRKSARAVEAVLDLHEWRNEVTGRLDAMDASLELMAETDNLRIKDALAGDRRLPVERRATA